LSASPSLPVNPARSQGIRKWIEAHPVRAATLAGWFQQGCSLLATAVTLPFIIRHLPPYEVGLWLTFQSCLYAVNLTNFGFTFALSRQVAFIIGARDVAAFADRSDFIATSLGWDGVSELYGAARILFRWVLLAATLLILGLFFLLEREGRVHMSNLPLWLTLGAGFLLNLLSQRFGPFLEGLGVMVYSRGIAGAYQIVWSVLAVAVLIVHPGLVPLAGTVLAASILQLIAFRAVLFSVSRGRLKDNSRVAPGLVGKLFRVAAPMGVVLSAGFCVTQIQIPLVGLFLGVEMVTPYYVAQRIGQTLFTLFNQTFQSQMPRFTQELGAGDALQAFHRMRRLVIFAGIGSAATAMVYVAASPLLVRLWLGPGHYVHGWVLPAMALDFALLGFTMPWSWFVLAAGTNPFVLSTIANGVLNLLFIAVLAPRLGLLGLPLAGILAGLATNEVYSLLKGNRLLSKLHQQSLASTPATPAVRYALLSDAMPLREGGSGTGVLSWNWLQALQEQAVLVLAPRPANVALARQGVEQCPVPVHYLPTPRFLGQVGWLSKLRGPLEVLLFLLELHSIGDAIRRSAANRIFAFAGARFWFLAGVRLLRWSFRLPIEIYLVDDFEAWQRLHAQTSLLPLLRRLEGGTLRRMDRIWAISPRYVRHLEEKYQVQAEWLPVTVRTTEVAYVPYRAAEPDVRSFIFIGAANALYRDALLAFARVLGELNASGKLGYQSRLDFYTYMPFEHCESVWKDSPHIRLHCQRPDEERYAALRNAWGMILAFSFEERTRLMVSTSFSTKFTESLTSGRPVIFFGPEDAAVMTYARNQGLPLVATSPAALPEVLEQIPAVDGPGLIARYEATLRQFHSASALRAYLAGPLPL
jgi:O-antigen/teichoic acid export membrane protein